VTNEDLGVDLEHAKALPACAACRKKSDGAVRVQPALGPEGFLCGTHYDEWMHSPEAIESPPDYANSSLLSRFATFIERLRRERYAACWAVGYVDPIEGTP
jgi:hypothetical protein